MNAAHLISVRLSRRNPFGVLLAMAFVLSACATETVPEHGRFAPASHLSARERALEVRTDGPFTVIKIEYRKPGSYFTSEDRLYYRVLFRGRQLLDEVTSVRKWPGITRSVWLVRDYHRSTTRLRLLHEKNGEPTLEQIENPALGSLKEYTWKPGILYFPRDGRTDAGFLLDADTFTTKPLPRMLAHRRLLRTEALAGIAPDGQAYAYADSPLEPASLVVLDQEGRNGPPLHVPVKVLAKDGDSEGAYPALVRWFEQNFVWTRDVQGRWHVQPIPDAASAKDVAVDSSTIEALFADPSRGYRSCFHPGHPACTERWATVEDEFTYRPVRPVNAFGAAVESIAYLGDGYQLHLKEAPSTVEAAAKRTLTRLSVPYVRWGQCLDSRGKSEDCRTHLHSKLPWPQPNTSRYYYLLEKMEANAQRGAVFATAQAIFVITPGPMGSSLISTLARYDLTP